MAVQGCSSNITTIFRATMVHTGHTYKQVMYTIRSPEISLVAKGGTHFTGELFDNVIF